MKSYDRVNLMLLDTEKGNELTAQGLWWREHFSFFYKPPVVQLGLCGVLDAKSDK